VENMTSIAVGMIKTCAWILVSDSQRRIEAEDKQNDPIYWRYLGHSEQDMEHFRGLLNSNTERAGVKEWNADLLRLTGPRLKE